MSKKGAPKIGQIVQVRLPDSGDSGQENRYRPLIVLAVHAPSGATGKWSVDGSVQLHPELDQDVIYRNSGMSRPRLTLTTPSAFVARVYESANPAAWEWKR